MAPFLVVDRLAFVRGEMDLMQYLLAVPEVHVAEMQAVLADMGGRFQYSLEDTEVEDAVSVLLRYLTHSRR